MLTRQAVQTRNCNGAGLIVRKTAQCATAKIFIIAIQRNHVILLERNGALLQALFPVGALLLVRFALTRPLGIVILKKNALAPAGNGAIATGQIIVQTPALFVPRKRHGTALKKQLVLIRGASGAEIIVLTTALFVQGLLCGTVIPNLLVKPLKETGAGHGVRSSPARHVMLHRPRIVFHSLCAKLRVQHGVEIIVHKTAPCAAI